MENRKNNRLVSLLDRLNRIQFASNLITLEESMHEFTHEMLQLKEQRPNTGDADQVSIFVQGDETILQNLESHGAVLILLQTMRRCIDHVKVWYHEGNEFPVSPQFFNSACIALVHFCFQNHRRSILAYQTGGFELIVDVMQTYRQIDYVQIICVAAMMVIGKTAFDDNNSWNIETIILQEIVYGMEFHPDDAKLYTVACSALAALFGPGSTVVVNHDADDDEEDWYHRAVGAICYGLVVHFEEPVALNVGFSLLTNMVGCSEVAEEMVAEVEKAAHGIKHCAAAA